MSGLLVNDIHLGHEGLYSVNYTDISVMCCRVEERLEESEEQRCEEAARSETEASRLRDLEDKLQKEREVLEEERDR